MAEYICREELRKHLKECYDNELFDADMRKATIGIDVYVENMPATDVKPVKYSSWEYRTYPIVDRDGVARRCMRGYVCKACGHGEPEEKRFCGGCGAEMRNE